MKEQVKKQRNTTKQKSQIKLEETQKALIEMKAKRTVKQNEANRYNNEIDKLTAVEEMLIYVLDTENNDKPE